MKEISEKLYPKSAPKTLRYDTDLGHKGAADANRTNLSFQEAELKKDQPGSIFLLQEHV